MKNNLVFVEHKGDYTPSNRAWIGKASYSKSGKTIYFDGKVFNGGKGIVTELESGDYYWISGVKKDGTDRHWTDNQPRRNKILIDEEVVEEYLSFRNLNELPKNLFEITKLNNIALKQESTKIFNKSYKDKSSILFQNESYKKYNG